MQPVRDVVDAMPIVRAWRALVGRGERGALLLLTALGFYTMLSLLTPVSVRVQRRLMAAHHFRPESMPAWVTIQLAPKMYGFAHRAWIGGYPLFGALGRDHADYRFDTQHFWVNHYPARRARFDGFRAEVFSQPIGARYIYLKSSYRGYSESSAYQVRHSDGQLHIRRLEDKP